MRERIFARALALAGELEGRQQELLRLLCTAACSRFAARLRKDLTPEDCGADFEAAAALSALAALYAVDERAQLQEFKAGDLTLKQSPAAGRETASRFLERQAQALMEPYLADGFWFLGV